jgi:release factor glutamine methyltransferase
MIDFLNCKIDISRKVFMPRPETEYWTRKAIEEIKEKCKLKNANCKPIKVLDIFAGSGCIGIAVLKNTKNTFVDFVDIDPNSLDQIVINLSLNKISPKRFKVIQSNIFQSLKKRKYNFILANPPYVALKRITEVDIEVLESEPHIALFAGEDGLFYIRRFLKEAKKYLSPQGKIYMEFDPQQIEEIEEILKKENFKFDFKKDQFKKWRFLTAEI